MEEKQLNPAESLEIINNMINTAKNKLADDGFLFIFWGWLICSASLIHYITIKANIPYGEWTWMIFIPTGIVVSIIYGIKQKKKSQVRTYVDVYLGYLWMAFIVALTLTLFFQGVHGFHATYFFLLLLYGMGTFISGGLLNFKPLIIGSLFSFALAVVSVFLRDEELLVCLSAALLFSYIIPGHLLHSKFRSQQ
jgi:hypothetical protein